MSCARQEAVTSHAAAVSSTWVLGKAEITASCLAASPAAQMAFFKENVLLWFFKDYNTVQGNIFELNDF